MTMLKGYSLISRPDADCAKAKNIYFVEGSHQSKPCLARRGDLLIAHLIVHLVVSYAFVFLATQAEATFYLAHPPIAARGEVVIFTVFR